jgi:hypothetical protein
VPLQGVAAIVAATAVATAIGCGGAADPQQGLPGCWSQQAAPGQPVRC